MRAKAPNIGDSVPTYHKIDQDNAEIINDLTTHNFSSGSQLKKIFDMSYAIDQGQTKNGLVMNYGDSLLGSKFKHLNTTISNIFSTGTRMTSAWCSFSVQSGSVDSVANAFDYWVCDTQVENLTDGTVVNMKQGGGNPDKATVYKVIYFKEPGAGSLTVTVGGDAPVVLDANGSKVLNIHTINRAESSDVVTIESTGNVKVVGVLAYNSTTNNARTADVGRGGMAIGDSLEHQFAVDSFKTFISDVAPFLFTFEMKEDGDTELETAYPHYLRVLSDCFDMQQYSDKLFISIAPTTTGDHSDQAVTLKELCDERGYTFYNANAIIPTYAEMSGRGWQGDGIHPAQVYHSFIASLMCRDLGIGFDRYQSSAQVSNSRLQPTQLESGSRVTTSNPDRDMVFETTDSGYDWKVEVERQLSVVDKGGNVRWRVTNNASAFPNVAPSKLLFDSPSATVGFNGVGVTNGVKEFRTKDSDGFGGSLIVNTGVRFTGGTLAELKAHYSGISSLVGLTHYASDARSDGGGCLVYASGGSNSWRRVSDDVVV